MYFIPIHFKYIIYFQIKLKDEHLEVETTNAKVLEETIIEMNKYKFKGEDKLLLP